VPESAVLSATRSLVARFSVDGETGAAAAGGFGVGVADREGAAHQLVGVVELRAGQQVEVDCVDDHAGGATLDGQVVGLGLRIKLEAVLEAAAAAGQDRDAECDFAGLLRLGDDPGDAGGGTGGGAAGTSVAERRSSPAKRDRSPEAPPLLDLCGDFGTTSLAFKGHGLSRRLRLQAVVTHPAS
jgi:hypothetical protein